MSNLSGKLIMRKKFQQFSCTPLSEIVQRNSTINRSIERLWVSFQPYTTGLQMRTFVRYSHLVCEMTGTIHEALTLMHRTILHR